MELGDKTARPAVSQFCFQDIKKDQETMTSKFGLLPQYKQFVVPVNRNRNRN